MPLRNERIEKEKPLLSLDQKAFHCHPLCWVHLMDIETDNGENLPGVLAKASTSRNQLK
jgi:hypothetical protein